MSRGEALSPQNKKGTIITAEEVYPEMLKNLREGAEKGTTTYIPELDQFWTWRRTEVNLDTGYANEGKSTWKRFLMLIKALEERKKFYLFAPEDAPAATFYDDIIHTLTGRSTDKTNKNFITEELYEEAYNLIKDLIFFISIATPHNTIENIVKLWRNVMESEDESIYGFLIDPYIRMTRSDAAPDRDDLYAAYIMSFLTEFARDFKVSVGMVMHQVTPRRLENGDNKGYYPQPNMYGVKGGGTFADMADNVGSVWRPKYAKEKIDTEVQITYEKIKKQKLVGVPGDIKFRFDRPSNRYVDYENPSIPIYNFDKWLGGNNKPKIRF